MKSCQLFIKTLNVFAIVLMIALLSTGIAHSQSIAKAGLLEDMEIRPGVRVEIPINIEDVVDLYGIDIELRFDPDFWEFEDADPRQEGIQPALGTFLDPGMTLFNEIYPEEGLVRLVLSQMNPSEAKSGSGTILVLYAKALKTGTTQIKVQKVEMATREGLGIEVEGVDGEIRITSQAPVVTATAIPVIDPTEIIIIPTYIPPTLTFTPVPTSTPRPTEVVTSQATVSEETPAETPEQPGQADERPEEAEAAVTAEVKADESTEIPSTGDGSELSQAQEGGNKTIWIIVVILAVAVILAVSFLVKNKRKN